MAEDQKGFFPKIYRFLRSMGFGMILLVLIILLSLAGSLITQGKAADFYSETYGWFGKVILALGWDHVYTVWYFGVLFGLLCVNLLLCSVLRSFRLKGAKKQLRAGALAAPVNVSANTKGYDRWLARNHLKSGDCVVKGGLGLYGSLVTHVGLLLLILSAAATLSLHTDTEYTLKLGESQQIGDLTVVANSFRTTNDEGETDYSANITITEANGTARTVDLSVNHPTTVGNRKFYQQSYEFAGIPAMVSTDPDSLGEGYLFNLDAIEDSLTFLSLDGKYGIALMDVYPDAIENEDGTYSPGTVSGGSMPNPAYLVKVITEEQTEEGIVFPGTTVEGAGIYVTYLKPQYNPVIMVKESPAWVLPFLYASFGILLIGFALCFCLDPRALAVKEEGITVFARKFTEDTAEKITEQMEEESLS